MANSLFEQFGKPNPYEQIVGQVQEFAKTIQGNPKQMVEQLLASGQLSQKDFNKYSQIAQQILPFMK